MPTRKSDPERYLPLHPLELQVLLALAGGPRHAYDVVKDIEVRQPEGRPILPTNLYRRIWRLAAEGLLEEAEVDPDPSERPRKYFRITALGRSVALAEAARMKALLAETVRSGLAPEEGSR